MQKQEWVPVNDVAKIGFASEVFVADEARLGDHVLSKRQITNIGEYETLDMTDEIALNMIDKMYEYNEEKFEHFKTIIRSGKYIVCRVPRTMPDSDDEYDKVFGPHNVATMTQCVYYRN